MVYKFEENRMTTMKDDTYQAELVYNAIIIDKDIILCSERPSNEAKYRCSYDGCLRLYKNMSSLRRHMNGCRDRTVAQRDLYSVKNMNMRGTKKLEIHYDSLRLQCPYSGCYYRTPIHSYLKHHMTYAHNV